jgi:endoglucanase
VSVTRPEPTRHARRRPERRAGVRRARSALAVCLLLAVPAVAFALKGGDGPPSTPGGASQAFLDRYVDGSGRVVRRDQGGDTVSEGQAYALLLAAASGDRKRFGQVWRWTRTNLQRRDGSLAWRWAHGRVTDTQPAPDADLDAARALLAGARRFGRPAYRRAGLRIARSILARSTHTSGDRLVLAAGPWARRTGTINPSYVSPRAFRALGAATGDGRWGALAESSRRLIDVLTQREPHLPPDWARFDGAGVTATDAPGTRRKAGYGFDAVRVPVRLAESCSAADRRLAARAWPALRARPGEHAAELAGAAGAAAAAGDRRSRDELLDRAADWDSDHPTYYGSAWVALGRVMLTSRTLGGCGS